MKHVLLALVGIGALIALSTTSCTKTKTVTVEDQGDTTWKHLRDSLWAYYPINGSTNDSTPNNHTLTLNGGASLSYDMWGNAQHAIDFPGGSAYGLIADGATFTPKAFSICFYIMPRAVSGLIFGKQDWSSDYGALYNIDIDPSNSADTLKFNITNNQPSLCTSYPNGSVAASCASNLLQVDSWYQIVATDSAGTAKLYINGALVGSTVNAETVAPCTVGQFILGNWWSSGPSPFNGRMTQVRIYSRALTPHEISYLFDYRL